MTGCERIASTPRSNEREIDAVAPFVADMPGPLGATGLAEAEPFQQAQGALVARIGLGADLAEIQHGKAAVDDRGQGLARVALAPHRGREQEADLVAVPQPGLADQQSVML